MVKKIRKIPKKQISNKSAIKPRPELADSFWSKLSKPFFVLAPMANVTDFAFRSMIAKYGKPDVMWTEFVSADGLNSVGKEKLLIDLKFSEKERPIVAQLFGSRRETVKKAVTMCAELGFDGVDLNMGCPDRAVEKQGGGAAMMKDWDMALEVLTAAREGWMLGKNLQKNLKQKLGIEKVGQNEQSLILYDSAIRKLPISIKTRIGYNKVDFDWLRLLLGQNLPALTIHLRTRKEMSDVPAHWELMPEIVRLRDEIQADIEPGERTLIIGNGDVESMDDAIVKAKKSGCDGVMIGRGIFGKPWFFEEIEAFRGGKRIGKIGWSKQGNEQKTPAERLKIMVEHAKLFEKTFRRTGQKISKSPNKNNLESKNFAIMRKHFKAYVSGWEGAKELRIKLMETENASQVDKIVKEYLKK